MKQLNTLFVHEYTYKHLYFYMYVCMYIEHIEEQDRKMEE